MAPFTSKQQGLQVGRVPLKYNVVKLSKKSDQSIDLYLFSFVRYMCVCFTSYHEFSCVSFVLIRSEFWRFPFSRRNFGARG